MLEKTLCRSRSSVGRAFGSPEKIGGSCVGSSPTDSNKKVPFFFKRVFVVIMQTGKPFRFHTPSSILVVGPSGCGKTVFTEKLLVENPDLFETPPTQLHYCYGA